MTFALKLTPAATLKNMNVVYFNVRHAIEVLTTEAHLLYLKRNRGSFSFPAIEMRKVAYSETDFFINTRLGDSEHVIHVTHESGTPGIQPLTIHTDSSKRSQFLLRYIGAGLGSLVNVTANDTESGLDLCDHCSPGTFNIGNIRPALQAVMYPDPLASHPKSFLLELGYDVDLDDDQPGTWIWTAPSDGCLQSYETAADALEAVWANAVEQTLRLTETTEKGFNNMSFRDQVALIESALA